MSVEVVIPWRDSGCEFRRQALAYTTAWWSKQFSVRLVDSRHAQFNRAAARNRGVASSNADIVIVADADVLVPAAQADAAVSLAKKVEGLVNPFEECVYVSCVATIDLYNHGDLSAITDLAHQGDPQFRPTTGRVFVMQRTSWLEAPMDELFEGWGGEDDAFVIQCRARGLDVLHVSGFAYHLYHPALRAARPKNLQRLQQKYLPLTAH